jgi:3-oxosteroid 1-dehydrogenase
MYKSIRIKGEYMTSENNPQHQISRRDFIKAAGVGALALGAAGSLGGLAGCSSGTSIKWDMTADVVVAGSGAGASAAACVAQSKGASVIMLEKSAAVGGTTMKSGGEIWIPNNFALKAAGKADPRTDCINFLARGCYPFLYNANDPQFGLGSFEYDNLAAYYDNASAGIDYMMSIGAINYVQAPLSFVDYVDHAPQNKVPTGRGLSPVGGAGNALIASFQAYIKAHNITLLNSNRVQQIYLNANKQVIGVQALDSSTATSKTVNVRARKAVIFGTGGFTHNHELVIHFQPGPLYGGCAVLSNTGDLVYMAQAIGAQLANMQNAWNCDIPLEPALASESTPNDIWQPPGDSMIIVNKYGMRFTDEKRDYNDRGKTHFWWDAIEQEYPNQITMMVYDQRTYDLMAGNYPFPGANDDKSLVITGQTFQELGTNIRARLGTLKYTSGISPAWDPGIFALDTSFETNLAATVAKFNQFAMAGVDSDFKRGLYPYDTAWYPIFSPPAQGTKWPTNTYPNMTMYPFTAQGPYYCILLGAGTLDTCGGPKINAKAQILDTTDTPIPGLYGAGNCIAPLVPYYISAGATIGNALTSGYIAGMNSVNEPVK